ncbi:hypothetical protein ANN_26980 [Periplaneta americana]|uniref:PiggyBac transposable element-derived protein 4 C-terminal zinc-ribbon domain-containing protein n=1 Tax=Periplaneta americana TaxID=6978 RepID=A0ABQ8RWT9_PERAM|nr:hypothetical protein ANN_26980 [Periplaneta americana]
MTTCNFRGITGYCFYQCSYVFTSKDLHANISRRDFGVNSGKALVSPHIQRRMLESRLPRTLRPTMKKIFGENDKPERREEPPKKRRRVMFAHLLLTTSIPVCSECNRTVCKKYCTVKIICNPCSEEIHSTDSDE